MLYVFWHAYYMLFLSLWDLIFNFNTYFTKIVHSTESEDDLDFSMVLSYKCVVYMLFRGVFIPSPYMYVFFFLF